MRLQEWVPYVIAAGNIISLLLTRDGHRSGFVLLVLAQALFVAYAELTGQQGFFLQNVLMTILAVHSWVEWTRTPPMLLLNRGVK